MNIMKLDEAIKAAAPVTGVHVADPNDRTTWVIDFKPEATSQQKIDAQNILNAFINPPDEIFVPLTKFLSLFTKSEETFIFTSNDWRVRKAIFLASAFNGVVLNSTQISQFLDLLIALGGLAANRKAVVLAGTAPS